MLRVAVVLVLSSGCASIIGPVQASGGFDGPSDPDATKFERCGTMGSIIGGAIDGVAIAGDLLISRPEYGLLDAVIIAPFAIDLLIGTAMAINCLGDD